MCLHNNYKEKLMEYSKKEQLFLQQKQTLDTFLKKGAITKRQYDKSLGDLVKKMGMESLIKK